MVAEHRHQYPARASAFAVCQSISKNSAYTDACPFSSTSSHHALSAPMTPMWFGTTSITCPMSCSASARDEPVEIFRAADFGIEGAVVDDVVAVPAAGARAQIRRAVNVADAELRQVRHDRGRVAKRESAMQLQAVGRARYAHRLGATARARPRGRRRTLRLEPGDERGKTRVGFPLLERHRQLAPPVRMLVYGARQVRLLADFHRIFELRDHQHRRRAREVRMQRLAQRGHGLGAAGRAGAHARRQQPLALQRAQRGPRARVRAR